ncbi:MAG TPA: PIG-L family deacetylase [Acidobacteriota bacterium]|nr:PIG-L family deacetylase [Acidobacteriota bacterium]
MMLRLALPSSSEPFFSTPFSLLRRILSLCALLLWSVPVSAQLEPLPEDEGVTGLGLALRKLGVTGSALYITAHPDDENNPVLVRLGRGDGLRTGLLTLTRGDGGQNEIGDELFQAIGVLRSEELLAIHRFDGARQFFSRAIDFGYSFSVEETFQKWGREEILEDAVRVIRTFRPTVILTLNPGGEGGGQHHQASARLALEAFRAAGDPDRFPEQIGREGLSPWQPLRLFQSFRRRVEDFKDGAPPVYTIETGTYDPLLGETWAEFGIRARTRHRCQGMNMLTRPGPFRSQYVVGDSADESETPRQGQDFYVGLDTGLSAIAAYDGGLGPALDALQASITEARRAYRASDYAGVSRILMQALRQVREARQSTHNEQARFLLREEETDLLDAAQKSHFLDFDALADETADGAVTASETFEVDLHYYDRSGRMEDIRLSLSAPQGWQLERIDERDGLVSYKVTAAPQAEISQPYWYRDSPQVERYAVRGRFKGMLPFAPPPLMARLEYRSQGVEAWVEREVHFRWYGADAGQERRMEVKVVPALALSLEPEISIVPLGSGKEQEIEVTVHNNRPGGNEAEIELQAPEGWTVEPRSRQLSFSFENERVTASFTVRPAAAAQGRYTVQARARSGGDVFEQGYRVISYPHVQTRHLYHAAAAEVQVLDVQLPENLEVGYVMGVGDDVAEATEQLGARLTLLDRDALAVGDLDRFDVIVTGVRAYLNRPDLVANNQRLLDYVRRGGHLVVQWNKYEFMRAQFTPYPVKIDRPTDRISVEEAPVKVLEPLHPLFNFPNSIGPDDWAGWVQERATYMLGQWEKPFTPLIEMEDPVPYNAGPKLGGLLVAPYGEGTYLHAGLAFFRQLPAGVPGAYRLWANILSLGRLEASGRETGQSRGQD